MNTEIIKSDHPVALPHAVDVLKHGGLVVFPTDTVYGLAALPVKDEYIERLYVVKGRESTRAIAILISSPDELGKISELPNDMAIRLAKKFCYQKSNTAGLRNLQLSVIASQKSRIQKLRTLSYFSFSKSYRIGDFCLKTKILIILTYY